MGSITLRVELFFDSADPLEPEKNSPNKKALLKIATLKKPHTMLISTFKRGIKLPFLFPNHYQRHTARSSP
jgi:hypothetical protein